MLSAPTITRERMPGEERVERLARWLANQRAIPRSMAEPTAWRLIEESVSGSLALEGPKAPLVVQKRFSLWLVGQLGGKPLMHVFVDPADATEKAREVGLQMDVPVLVIDGGGEITKRFDCAVASASDAARVSPPSQAAAAPARAAAPATAPVKSPARPTVLTVDRHDGRWAVFAAGQVIVTAPTRDRARARARTLKADPDFMADPRPVAD